MNNAETIVSELKKMKESTSDLWTATDGRTRTEEMKATWKETRMWFAMTHPS
jgi:hypothetical protein